MKVTEGKLDLKFTMEAYLVCSIISASSQNQIIEHVQEILTGNGGSVGGSYKW